MEKIAIVGAGAAGSYLGAFMTRAGEDITLIDQWPAHVEAMKAGGLKVTGSQGPFTTPVKALHLHEVQGIEEPFDVVFIALKSYDTLWAATFIEPYLKPTGCVVSSQNGINDEVIASVVGHHRAVGCVMSQIGVALWEPGQVARHGEPGRNKGHAVFRVGELNGTVTPRVRRIVQLVSSIDGARATTNLWGERWAKLANNCMGNPVNAMSGLGSQGLADLAEARLLKMHTAKETVQVGRALNYNIESVGGVDADTWLHIDEGDVFEELDNRLQAKTRADWHSSMGQDVIKRRRTEIDYLNGLVSQKGMEAGVATPVDDATVAMLHDIEAGRVAPDPSNIGEVLRQAGVRA